ncbi:hypothetical protein [Paraburkholderia xenovorans]
MAVATTVSGILAAVNGALGLITKGVATHDESVIEKATQTLVDEIRELNVATLQTSEDNVRLIKSVATLEHDLKAANEEIAKLKAKKRELSRYELTPITEGPVVYRLKSAYADKEPIHYRCPKCVNADKTGYLQPVRVKSAQYLVCADCEFEYFAGFLPPPDYSKLIALMAR